MTFMISLQPDLNRFVRFATRERLLPAGEDAGYAWHAALAASFGELAPKPFRWFPPRTRAGGARGRLLAYSSHSLDALQQRARLFADPAMLDVLQLDAAAAKLMPSDFVRGQRLGFEVRVRPISRTGADRRGGRPRERDVFDAAQGADRASVYVEWLSGQFSRNGLQLLEGHVDSLQLTVLMTRSRSGKHSTRTATLGPDVLFRGTMIVQQEDTFTELLARGIGRHRAFGFGMLLLRPA